MATTIKLKNGSGAPLAADLVQGEPAFDLTNKRLYTENASGTVIEIGTSPSTIDINAGTIDGTVIGGASAAAGTFTTLNATGGGALTGTWSDLGSVTTVDINGGTIDGVTIGGASAGAGTFTTLTTGSTVTLNGGTANGVLYLNGSKVATSGSALTFDGSKLTVGTSTAAGALTVLAPASTAYGTFDAPTAGFAFTDYKYNGTRYGLIGQAGALFSGASQTDFGIVASSSFLFGANGSEQMRLTSTGLGIGTSSPSQKLDVLGSIAVRASTSGANQDIVALRALNSDNTAYANAIYYANSHRWAYAGATEGMRLDSSGNLGLGVTPSAWYSLYKANQIGSSTSLWGIASGAGGSYLSNNLYLDATVTRRYLNSSYATEYSQLNGEHQWLTAASGTAGNTITFTQAMTLDASGRLGIGTTSPSADLHINGTTTDIRITNTANTSGFDIGLLGGDSDDNGYVFNRNAGSQLIFGTANTERMRIDSSGNVGIGTSSPTSPLDISSGTAGTSKTIASFSHSQSGSVGSAARITLGLNSTSRNAYIESITTSAGNSHDLIFATNGGGASPVERMRIDSNGNLLVGGTTAGTASAGNLVLFNGTAPTGNVTNGITLYAEDVSASSELKVRDEAGNVTTLSPHNFDLIPEGPSEDMAWSYYSERDGKRINVDMLKAIRLLEQLTGEKLVHTN